MYYQLEYIYNLFNNYDFRLFKKEFKNNKILLEFCKIDNIIDKFSIILHERSIETIIPLKEDNKSYKCKINNFENTINYLKLHIENYYNNKI